MRAYQAQMWVATVDEDGCDTPRKVAVFTNKIPAERWLRDQMLERFWDESYGPAPETWKGMAQILFTDLSITPAFLQEVTVDGVIPYEDQPELDVYRQYAIANLAKDEELEIDWNARVSKGDDHGAYVECWTWISDEACGMEWNGEDEGEEE